MSVLKTGKMRRLPMSPTVNATAGCKPFTMPSGIPTRASPKGDIETRKVWSESISIYMSCRGRARYVVWALVPPLLCGIFKTEDGGCKTDDGRRKMDEGLPSQLIAHSSQLTESSHLQHTFPHIQSFPIRLWERRMGFC